MDFFLFLLFAVVIFIISNKLFKPTKDKPQQTRRQVPQSKAVQSRSSQSQEQSNQPKLPLSRKTAVQKTLHSPVRPSVPILLGIEITAAQQRRLGKDDPSVLAANRAKQLHEQSDAPSFFEKLGQQIEKAAHQMDDAAQQQKNSAKELKKEDLNKLFNDLFIKKK
ncbi:MAG: hypothetical protein ACN6NX_13840 [Acinetobacter sp.]